MYIIGIAGGTGSGKTSIAKAIASSFNSKEIKIIQQDSYYKDLSKISLEERSINNFDHPNAIDFMLMKKHLTELSDGKQIVMPEYDFSTHTRKKNTHIFIPPKTIILEGIFTLHDPEIRNLMDLKIFIETADDIRIMRRIKRDVNKRNRTLTSVINQYKKTVRPMHEKFVAKTKKHADIIIPEGSHNKKAIDLIIIKVMATINEMDKIK